MRVPHPGRVTLVVGAVEVGGDAEGESAATGISRGVEGDRAHVDGGGDDVAGAVAGELDLATTAAGVDDERAVLPEAVARPRPTPGVRMPLPLISAMPPSAL